MRLLTLMNIPILVPLLVASCIFGPLLLSLREVSDLPGSSPGGGAGAQPVPDGPMPLRGDSHAVEVDALEVEPTTTDTRAEDASTSVPATPTPRRD